MLKINAVFSKKIWGGDNLKKYGFNIPSNKTGEAWVISAYDKNSSKLDNGETLRNFYSNNKELFNNYPSNEFPLLAKIIDANDDLSIQVHPNDEMAQKLEGYPYGKTECWYIVDAKENANIVIGINANSKDEAKTMIDNNEWNKLLKTHSIQKGDIFNISAGTVHAIKSGTLIYELQQSSNITYRFYDYDRLENGKKRELHIDKSLDATNYESIDFKRTPQLINKVNESTLYKLIENDIFDLEKWEIKNEVKLSYNKDEKNFLLVTIIEGEANINGTNLNSYESGIITSVELENIEIIGNATILVGNPK